MFLAEKPFKSIQGEGMTVGRASLFIRLAGCNMKPLCEWCDTKFALSKKDSKEYSVAELQDMIEKQNISNIVFTGGEPLLYQEEIVNLIFQLTYGCETKDNFYTFEIETNGLIAPWDYLKDEYNITFNVSPKRQNINIDVLKKFKNMYTGVCFKFVIRDSAKYDDFEFFQKEVIKKLDIDHEYVYLMPEGTDSKKIKKNIIDLIRFYCLKHNYNLSPRLQVMLWGDERGK